MQCSDSRTEGCPGTNSANSEAPGHGDAHLYIRPGGRHALFGEMVSWTQRVLSLYAQRGSRDESFPCTGSARCGEYEQKKKMLMKIMIKSNSTLMFLIKTPTQQTTAISVKWDPFGAAEHIASDRWKIYMRSFSRLSIFSDDSRQRWPGGSW